MSNTTEKLRSDFSQIASDAENTWGDACHGVRDEGQQGANETCTMEQRAEKVAASLGAGLETLGSTIRAHTPATGVLATAGESTADKLTEAGRYLEKNGLSGMGEDLTNLIRRNPIPALLGGIGFGLILARIMRR
jgi:hypothetical protein